MSDLQVSHNPAIAVQQLALQREKINANASLTPDAKEWHIRSVERAFADAMYGQTLSWPARIIWTIGSIPASLAWSLYNFRDILRYGMLGGNGVVAADRRSLDHLAIEDERREAAGNDERL